MEQIDTLRLPVGKDDNTSETAVHPPDYCPRRSYSVSNLVMIVVVIGIREAMMHDFYRRSGTRLTEMIPSGGWAIRRVGLGQAMAAALLLPVLGLPLESCGRSPGSSGAQVPAVRAGLTKFSDAHRADWDGDGFSDLNVFRPGAANGSNTSSNWAQFIYEQSSNGAIQSWNWGRATDLPLLGDFDGDRREDLNLFRPATGQWFSALSSAGFQSSETPGWGQRGDIPVPGDYDGDGKTDFAVWRPYGISANLCPSGATVPCVGYWWPTSSKSPGSLSAFQWGAAGDIPVPADYDGDGITDMTVWRPSTQQWIPWLSSIHNYAVWPGPPGSSATDIPIPGLDYDGDGKADLTIYQPVVTSGTSPPNGTGTWYYALSTQSYVFYSYNYYQFTSSTNSAVFSADGATAIPSPIQALPVAANFSGSWCPTNCSGAYDANFSLYQAVALSNGGTYGMWTGIDYFTWGNSILEPTTDAFGSGLEPHVDKPINATKSFPVVSTAGWTKTAPSADTSFESSALTIPPNSANCGANGAAFLSSSRYVTKQTLTCWQSQGTVGCNTPAALDLNALDPENVAGPSSTHFLPNSAPYYNAYAGAGQPVTPAGVTDFLFPNGTDGTSDQNIIRMNNGHSLIQHLAVRWENPVTGAGTFGACPAACTTNPPPPQEVCGVQPGQPPKPCDVCCQCNSQNNKRTGIALFLDSGPNCGGTYPGDPNNVAANPAASPPTTGWGVLSALTKYDFVGLPWPAISPLSQAQISNYQVADPWMFADTDRGMLFNNPFSGNVYFTVQLGPSNCVPYISGGAQSVVFQSKNYGQTWASTAWNSNQNPNQIDYTDAGWVMTAAPPNAATHSPGRMYIFGCDESSNTIAANKGYPAVNPYQPTILAMNDTTGVVYPQRYGGGQTCTNGTSPCPGPQPFDQIAVGGKLVPAVCGVVGGAQYEEPNAGSYQDGSWQISLVSSEEDGDVLRVVYPRCSDSGGGANKSQCQGPASMNPSRYLHVETIRVSGEPTLSFTKIAENDIFPSNPQSSMWNAAIIQPDYIDLPYARESNAALLYWMETNGFFSGGGAGPATTYVTVKGTMLRDTNIWAPVFEIANVPNWWNNWSKTGDYVWGGFAYDSSSDMLDFFPVWEDSSGNWWTNMMSAHP
jgi:hypothetical protein